MGQNVEEPQGSVKIKMQVNCVSTSGNRSKGLRKNSRSEKTKTLVKNPQGNYVLVVISF